MFKSQTLSITLWTTITVLVSDVDVIHCKSYGSSGFALGKLETIASSSHNVLSNAVI